MGENQKFKWGLIIGVALLLGACASNGEKLGTDNGDYQEWAAVGYFKPEPEGDGELIGVFDSKKACEAARSNWLQTQVAGTAISALCLGVDPH